MSKPDFPLIDTPFDVQYTAGRLGLVTSFIKLQAGFRFTIYALARDSEGRVAVSFYNVVVPFVVILCTMVVIHEFGHFIVAKLLGIPAEVFSVGFGPRLFGFKLGETDFRFSAVPLGGYVRFKGENLEMLQGKSEADADEFLAHAGWKRLLVALAGPVFNIVTAIVIPAAAIMIGFQDDVYNAQKVVIGEVKPGSTAEAAGLQKGDRIVAYRNRQNPTWQDFQDDVSVRFDEEIPLTVERNGQLLQLKVKPRAEKFGNDTIGRVDLDPPITHINVNNVSSGTPAERAGLKAGDKIIAINGTSVFAWSHFRRTVQEGKEVTLAIERGGQPLEVKLTPEKQGDQYMIGISRSFDTVLVKANSLSEALSYGLAYNVRIVQMTGVVIKQMVNGSRSARNAIGGPLRIAKETATTYEMGGWSSIIRWMGILSLNLGVFNLLPIPVLDGGMILLIIVEWILGLVGMTLTMNMRERFQQVGFVIVMLLMGFVIVNDSVSIFWSR